mgnify:CR=1 FL=1
MTETLVDVFMKEQIRVRELLGVYKEIGPAGAFGAAMIEQVLQRADKAAIEGDAVAIMAALGELKECA